MNSGILPFAHLDTPFGHSTSVKTGIEWEAYRDARQEMIICLYIGLLPKNTTDP